MNIRKFSFLILSFVLILSSCKKDDEPPVVELRDRQEVYDENLLEIESYLETHFYNYEDFDAMNPYTIANDDFEIVFDTIEGVNSGKTPLMDQVEFKTVTQDGIDYKLYTLKVREGLGNDVHALDKAVVSYNGSLSTGVSFDSAVTPISFNLTTVGSVSGVVTGFREGLAQFKASDDFTENTDGSVVYHNHGIGAVFIPSGLGYFATGVGAIPTYSPIFFRFSVISRNNTDFDLDGIPSHLEDLDGDGDGLNENTDEDLLVNFIDNDDDGDGVLTRDEVVLNEMNFATRAEAEGYLLATNEIFVNIVNEDDNTFTLHTTTLTDTNADDIPDYLDSAIAIEVE